jgi:hypothetical protein
MTLGVSIALTAYTRKRLSRFNISRRLARREPSVLHPVSGAASNLVSNIFAARFLYLHRATFL